MKIGTTAAVIAPLLLAGLLAAAPQPGAAQSTPPSTQTQAGDESDKSSYVDKAKEEMAEWRAKLDRFSEDAKAKGHELSAKAKTELDEAWRKTEDAGHKLQATSAEGWDNAKSAYQRAKLSLENTWDRVRQSGE